jgi:alcohol dehydrogenase class IV
VQQSFVSRGAISHLPYIVEKTKSAKIILFHGKHSFAKHEDSILPLLSNTKFDAYSNISPNTKYEEVVLALKQFHAKDYDMVVAVGGGSVIDFAKSYKHYSESEIPLVAIPTTAGTGSEATQFAVIYINGKKHSLDKPNILPNFAIVDSQLLDGAPQYLKACTALDAYCQAIESFWAVGSTRKSRDLAVDAITLINDSIEDFVLTNSAVAADQMANAAFISGQAINISRTTAAHALSYAITTQHNIPPGHAVALSIPDLFVANINVTEETCQDPRGYTYVRNNMDVLLDLLKINKSNIATFFYSLYDKLGIEWRFSKLGITDRHYLQQAINMTRLANNPKNISEDLPLFWSRDN